jgi:hypothetical protein
MEISSRPNKISRNVATICRVPMTNVEIRQSLGCAKQPMPSIAPQIGKCRDNNAGIARISLALFYKLPFRHADMIRVDYNRDKG